MREIPVPQLSPQDVAEIWFYDPETGAFSWKKKVAKNVTVGRQTGFTDGRYQVLRIKDQRFYAHRVAWAIFYGAWPTLEIDHINGIKSDNRIENLRQATTSQNTAYAPVHSDSLTGVKGVTKDKRDGRYYAYIDVDGKRTALGGFTNIKDANAARIAAEKTRRGEFFFHRS